MDAYQAADDFLTATYGMPLEEVLCDGCYVGRLPAALAEAGRIMPRLTRSVAEEDGGIANTYEGILDLRGIWYRFRCHLFVDRGGQRFLSDISAFEAIEWQTRLAVSA